MKEKFDPDSLKLFDKVLVRCGSDEQWIPIFFGRWVYNRSNYHKYAECIGDGDRAPHYDEVIPYNKETEYLAYNYDDAPEYYTYWMLDIYD